MKYQVVVKVKNQELPNSPLMEEAEAHAAVAKICEAQENGEQVDLPWLAVRGYDIVAASVTPVSRNKERALTGEL